MCYLWREKESPHLSLEQFVSIFERNDFSFIRSVVLTGGEPTLRADLPDLFKLILAHMPKLEHVQLATNGLNTERTIADVIQMAEAWEDATVRSARFDVQISLDGLGEVHDMMRGIPGFFDHVCETLDQLQWLRSQFPWLVPRLSCVVTPYNLPHLEALHTFAEQRDLPIHYNPAVISDAYYANSETNSDLVFDPSEIDTAREFFQRLAGEEASGLRFYYQDMAQMFYSGLRKRRCMMGFYGFVLEHMGDIYPCVNCEHKKFGNLLIDSFESVWFGDQAAEVRDYTAENCCPSCTSGCLSLPVGIAEMLKLRKLISLGFNS
jgi:MoaA/NifB/PqqE/SkfB family radical SAM enzyme